MCVAAEVRRVVPDRGLQPHGRPGKEAKAPALPFLPRPFPGPAAGLGLAPPAGRTGPSKRLEAGSLVITSFRRHGRARGGPVPGPTPAALCPKACVKGWHERWCIKEWHERVARKGGAVGWGGGFHRLKGLENTM